VVFDPDGKMARLCQDNLIPSLEWDYKPGTKRRYSMRRGAPPPMIIAQDMDLNDPSASRGE